MNEHDQEEDWIRLGQRLRDYQPAGRPDQDFAALQSLQRAERRSPRRLLAWLGLGIVLLAAGAIFFLQPFSTNEVQQARHLSSEEPPISLTTPLPVGESTAIVNAESPRNMGQEITTAPVPAKKLHPQTNTNSFTTFSTLPEYLPEPSLTTAISPPLPVHTEAEVLPFVERRYTGAKIDAGVEGIGKPDQEFLESTPEIMLREVDVVDALEWPSINFTSGTAIKVDEPVAPPTVIKPTGNHAAVTLNAGLSTHWRGATFLAEPDQGVYVSVGAQQRIGRFSIGGRFGYRGHNMNLEILEGDAEPWSHYEEKTNEFNDELGEEVEYTYVGVVNGYKGVEFSLLLGYHLNARAMLQAGGRYSLPSLQFRRTVHSSHDGDVTGQPSPYHFFATEQPLVKYHDYGALLGGQYRIGQHLSLEAMLHLGMVDLIEDEGERMNRFNHSSSVSIGISYLLR